MGIDDIQHKEHTLDKFDRRILRALSADARQTSAAIGEAVNLSASAVNARIRRMRDSGVILAPAARLNAAAIGKPLLTFIHVDTEGSEDSQPMMELANFPEIEEMHSVAGNTCVILKVRTAGANALEHFLAQLRVFPGVRGTNTFGVLSTYLERTVQAEVTENWPASLPLPE